MRPVENVLSVYRQATDDEKRHGMSWYQSAHDAIASLGVSVECAAGVVAALSPGLRWEINIEAAKRVIQRRSLKGLGVRYSLNIRKAKAIAKGKHPLDVLGGNKVRAFYCCLVNPSQCSGVCVDGHAFSIYKGKRIPVDSTPTITDKLYRKISQVYSLAAAAVGIEPHQMQAITWVTWRRLHVKQFQA